MLLVVQLKKKNVFEDLTNEVFLEVNDMNFFYLASVGFLSGF